jgi:uncharacterized membrane protein YcaP (DUF421 family)
MTLPEIGSSLPDIVLRTAVVYLFLVVALRISGKREVGQFSIFELVVVLVISNAVQNAMVGENTSLWAGLVAVVTLLGLDIALRTLTRRFRRLRRVLEGEPRLLVRDGQVLPKAMRREGIEEDDLIAAIHRTGLERIDEVRLAILEVDGSISVIPKKDGVASPSSGSPEVQT